MPVHIVPGKKLYSRKLITKYIAARGDIDMKIKLSQYSETDRFLSTYEKLHEKYVVVPVDKAS